jgi:hypothetical protein
MHSPWRNPGSNLPRKADGAPTEAAGGDDELLINRLQLDIDPDFSPLVMEDETTCRKADVLPSVPPVSTARMEPGMMRSVFGE